MLIDAIMTRKTGGIMKNLDSTRSAQLSRGI